MESLFLLAAFVKKQHNLLLYFYLLFEERGGNIDSIQALQKRIKEICEEEPYMGEMIPVR